MEKHPYCNDIITFKQKVTLKVHRIKEGLGLVDTEFLPDKPYRVMLMPCTESPPQLGRVDIELEDGSMIYRVSRKIFNR